MSSSANSRIAKNTVFLTIRMIFVLIVSLYTSRVFLNVLGVSDYGISNIVSGFVSMFSFMNGALANGIQRFYNYEIGANGNKSIGRVYSTALLIQGVIALVVVLLLETAGVWYLKEKMVIPQDRFDVAFWLFQFSIISSTLAILRIPYDSAVLAFEKMDFYAIVNILDVCLKLAFALLIKAVPIDKLLSFGLFTLAVSLINFVINVAYCKIKFKRLRFKLCYDRDMSRKMLSFSGWNMLGVFACMAREQGLNLVLNLFFGPVVNAARAISYQVSGALQSFVQNLSIAAKPQMIQSYASGDSTRTMKLMYSMSKLSFIFLYFMALPVIFEKDYILHIWLGNTVPEHTGAFIILVLLTSFFNNLNAPLSNVVYATGKMRRYEITFFTINILIIPVSYIALKAGGRAEIAFVIYFVTSIIVQVACLLVLKTLTVFSIWDYLRKVFIPIVIVAALSFVFPYMIHVFMPEGLGRLCVVTVVTIIISAIIFYCVAMTDSEKQMTKGAIETVKSRLFHKR